MDAKDIGNQLKKGLGIIGSVYAGLETLRMVSNKVTSTTKTVHTATQSSKVDDHTCAAAFLAAVSEASQQLQNTEKSPGVTFTHEEVNARAKMVNDVIGAFSPSERKDIMRIFGTMDNARNTTIMRTWLLMESDTLKSVLSSLVLGNQTSEHRWNTFNAQLKDFNDSADEFFNDNMPQSGFTIWDSIPIINLIMAKRESNNKKQKP